MTTNRIDEALTKGLEDLLAHAGIDVHFLPDFGRAKTLRVVYGKSFNQLKFGNFEAKDYEHQFLCRASDIIDQTKDGEITFNGRAYIIVDEQILEPAAMLYAE
ncbi:MAG: hypothetical protein HRT38_02745 [Alteromonadaceae bacterium]|nr:hypothetical protein [Alteromonadaceae bacterium]